MDQLQTSAVELFAWRSLEQNVWILTDSPEASNLLARNNGWTPLSYFRTATEVLPLVLGENVLVSIFSWNTEPLPHRQHQLLLSIEAEDNLVSYIDCHRYITRWICASIIGSRTCHRFEIANSGFYSLIELHKFFWRWEKTSLTVCHYLSTTQRPVACFSTIVTDQCRLPSSQKPTTWWMTLPQTPWSRGERIVALS